MTETSAHWHILTVTRGGVVSLLRNLTEEIARQTMQRLPTRGGFDQGDPWGEYAIYRRVQAELDPESLNRFHSGSYMASDGDLARVECFGPEGQELEVWPKPDDYEARYEAALAKARSEQKDPSK